MVKETDKQPSERKQGPNVCPGPTLFDPAATANNTHVKISQQRGARAVDLLQPDSILRSNNKFINDASSP